MAITIYSNGIVEEFKSSGDTFLEHELVKSFKNYHTIRSKRIPEILNTWCLWGEMDDAPANEFNKIGSDIIKFRVDSHIIFIHDSELNPEWNLSDKNLQKDYEDFTYDVKTLIDYIAEEFHQEIQENRNSGSMIFLTAMGQTKDKRVLFSFNPGEQIEDFYSKNYFNKFAEKIYEYLMEGFEKDGAIPFIIFADSKTIVIVEDQHVDEVLDRIIHIYKKKENYEVCSNITKVRKEWRKAITPKKIIDSSTGKRRTRRPPKNKE